MAIGVWRKLCRSALVAIFAAVGFVATASVGWCADQAWDDCTSKDPDTSIAGCTKVLARGASETSGDRANAYYNRGLAYDTKGDHDRAVADYDKSIELNPKDADRYFARGAAYDDEGDYDRAIADFDTAIGLKPDYADAYYSRGRAYRQKGNYDRAIADYDKDIELNPTDVDGYRGRGLAYHTKLKATTTAPSLTTARLSRSIPRIPQSTSLAA
jgi:tetratricopeptide (TPR) repeat protein